MPESSVHVPQGVGGSFAPPLDAAKLEEYRALAAEASPEVGEAMNSLIKMMESFHDRPAPKKGERAPAGIPHPSGLGLMVKLPDAEVKRLWDVVPWEHEVEMYKQLFDTIDPAGKKALRDAAFHLAWYARELTIDRVPLTKDQLGL